MSRQNRARAGLPQARRVEDKAKDQILVSCKRSRQERHTPYLPRDIIFKILILTPAEVLHEVVKFVCKQWYDVVGDPLFVKAHCQSSSVGLLLQEPSNLNHFNFIEGDTTGELKAKEIQLPFPARVLGSFNGLVLLEDLKDPLLCCTHVMNPVTKVIISLPPVVGSKTHRSTGVGLSSSGQYKVVHADYGSDHENVQMWVFTVGVDKDWRSIDVQGRNISLSTEILPPYFIAGMIYWPGRINDSGIALDVNDETICEFSIRRDFYEYDFCMRDYLSMGTGLGIVRRKVGDIWELWELTGVKTDEWTLVAGIDIQ